MDDSAELQRLREETDALRRRIARVAGDNEHLESRVERMEASVIFRSLRRIGRGFEAAQSSFRRAFGLPDPALAKSEREYAAWIRETALVDSLRPTPCADVSNVSFLVDAGAGERTLASIEAQKGGRIYQNSDVREIIETISKDFVAIVGAGAILEPDAVRCWLAAVQENTIAAYSDWDEIDSNGRRHSPRFTPELSPELLLQTMYWGRCFLVRAAALRNVAGKFSAHDLALRLTDTGAPIARVPRILWHATTTAGETKPAGARGAAPTDRASIVICTRNPKLLAQCLASLRRTIGARHEVIVVAHQIDGGSELRAVAGQHNARTVDYHGAFHFGLMNGAGVAASTGSVLVLMNDDVQPVSADWLESMLAQAVRPDVGVVGALLLYPDGSVQHAGIVMGNSNVPAHAGRFSRTSPFWPWLKMTREVSAVTGACFALRRSVWDELGGFDRNFPVNYNDVDFCLRARQRGYRVLIETRAVLTHKECQTRTPVVRA